MVELAGTSSCLDMKTGGTANGTQVQLYSCNGNVDQEWKPLSGGELEAVHATTARGTTVVLDVPSGHGNGTKFQIWQMNGGAPQFWAIPELNTGDRRRTNRARLRTVGGRSHSA
jgi:glucosylceramidase